MLNSIRGSEGCGDLQRAPGFVFVGTTDNPEFKPSHRQRQAAHIARQFRIGAAHAAVVAELAFAVARPR